MKKFSKTLRDNWIFLLMVLPGTIWLILFFYIPVFGNVVAFKNGLILEAVMMIIGSGKA